MTATTTAPSPQEVTVDLKARIGRRFRRTGGATGIPQHVVMFEVPVDSIETRADLEANARSAKLNAGASFADLGPGAARTAAFMAQPAKRRRLDALAVGQWGPVAGQLIGFEVKATRADLLAELRHPLKHQAGARYCHRWWLVAAHRDLLTGLDLPDTWGILVPHGAGLKAHRPAPPLEPIPPTPRLVAAIAASATTQAIANDVRGIRAVAADLAGRYGAQHPETRRLTERLEAEHRHRFPT